MMKGDIIIHWLDRTRAKHKQKGMHNRELYSLSIEVYVKRN